MNEQEQMVAIAKGVEENGKALLTLIEMLKPRKNNTRLHKPIAASERKTSVRLPRVERLTPLEYCKLTGGDKQDAEELCECLLEEGKIYEVDRGKGFEGYKLTDKTFDGRDGYCGEMFWVKFPLSVYENPENLPIKELIKSNNGEE